MRTEICSKVRFDFGAIAATYDPGISTREDFEMKLEHVALSVTDSREIEDFYHDVLGMREQRTFVLSADLAAEIFGTNDEVTICLMQKDSVFFEIFISTSKHPRGYTHTCLSFDDKETVLRRAKQKGYDTIRVRSKNRDLTFLRDRDDNLIEIKEERGPLVTEENSNDIGST